MIITTCGECRDFEPRSKSGVGWCKQEGKLCFASNGCSEGRPKEDGSVIK